MNRQISELKSQLNDRAAGVRYGAVQALRDFGFLALEVLSDALHHTDSAVISEAALGLADIGPAAASAVPSLIKLLRHRAAVVRYNAVFALGRIRDPSAVPALSAVLNDQNPDVCKAASTALNRIAAASSE